jgi:hypothetical protein
MTINTVVRDAVLMIIIIKKYIIIAVFTFINDIIISVVIIIMMRERSNIMKLFEKNALRRLFGRELGGMKRG